MSPTIENTAAAVVKRAKTGGRQKNTPNKPKVEKSPAVRGGAPADGVNLHHKKGQFPAYRLVRTDQLVPYATNARTHTDAQIAKIAVSIKEFGFTNPVLTDGRKGIVAGHGRVLAAQQLGMDVVPSIELSHLSAAQRRAYVLADNRLAEDAGWDEALLASELGELSDFGFDLSLTGFSERELVQFMAGGSGLTDPDEAPEVEAVAVSLLGDVWLLGKHRLVCGDCTDAEVVAHALAGRKAQMVFTDPPYGVDYTGGAKTRGRLAGDHVGTDIYGAALANLADAADDKAPLYLWYADGHAAAAAAAAAAAGYLIVAQIIWAKNHAQFVTAAHYKGKHEPCFYAHRKGKSARWHGPNNEVTLWECNRSPRNDFHPTQKPVELGERAINNSTAVGELVLDLFIGGGSTIIAAEKTGRACAGVEIAPQFIDVAVRRWQAFTGQQATLDSTGATFDTIAAERLAA